MPVADRSRFSYHRRAVRVVFGAGSLATVRDEVARAGIRRPLVLATPGRSSMGADLAAALGDDIAGVFNRAAPHVPAPLIVEARDEAVRLSADGLVTIGGGSAIGLGKAVAREIPLPLVAIPTTYSGSEMTEIWGVTDAHGKRTARDPRAAPKVVIYDPELTRSLSPAVSATSGMNAMAHAVEALYAPELQPLTALAAEEAIRELGTSLLNVLKHPDDIVARTSALRAAHLSGIALDSAAMGLHHKLAHVLGGSFGLPHAETHAVLLPHVVAYNEPAAPEAMRVIANALAAASASEGLRALNQSLGVTYGLRDLGLRADDIDRAAEIATSASYPNPRPPTPAEVREILQRAY